MQILSGKNTVSRFNHPIRFERAGWSQDRASASEVSGLQGRGLVGETSGFPAAPPTGVSALNARA